MLYSFSLLLNRLQLYESKERIPMANFTDNPLDLIGYRNAGWKPSIHTAADDKTDDR